MENDFFSGMDVPAVSESGNAGPDSQHTLNGSADQLSSDYFANSFTHENSAWDSILKDFTIESALQDPGTFNTSLLSMSPVTSASFRNTPDTVVSNVCTGANDSGDDIANTTVAPGDVNKTVGVSNDSQQQSTVVVASQAQEHFQQSASSLTSGPAANNFQQPGLVPSQDLASATIRATRIAAGTVVCSAATSASSSAEPVLVMNMSPRNRISHLPPKIGADGEIKYLEAHEMPQLTPEMLQRTAHNAASNNLVLPPELEKHMFYPPGQGPRQHPQQITQQMPAQRMQEQHSAQTQQHQTNNIQQFQYAQEAQYGMTAQGLPDQPLNDENSLWRQNLQQVPQSGNFHQQQQNRSPSQFPQQQYFQSSSQFLNGNMHFAGMHTPRSVPQQLQQPMVQGQGQINIQPHPAIRVREPELYYTADGYKSELPRAGKSHDINSHEWLRNRENRSTWNFVDLYSDWLDRNPKTVEPHVKPFLKKDVKLGMSSQDATKAAITDGFARGAGWAARLFLTQIEKEIRDKGTMLGFKPHKKVQKAELERSFIEDIVKTNPPFIHGSQCANVIAWAYDEFYPGVFHQEDANGKPRSPQEIFDAWKTLRETVVPDQLKPVLFDTSTGLTAMTDLQPSRPPVAQIRAFGKDPALRGSEPSIKINQFSGINPEKGHTMVASGQSFFTNPEGPATMALQQPKRTDSAAQRSTPKPPGARALPKTAEEKKEERNRKVDEKIKWTLTGPVHDSIVEGKVHRFYMCSDGQARILEGQRLKEARDRTSKLFQKQQRAAALANAAGISAPSNSIGEVPAQTTTGGTATSDGQPGSITAHQQIQPMQTIASNATHAKQPVGGEVKRKRVLDEESTLGRRKRARKGAKQGLKESSTGDEMLLCPSLSLGGEN